MLFRKTVVYYEDYMEHTNAHCEQNADFNMLKQVVHVVTTDFLQFNIQGFHWK
jgi:hypothetical protein